MKNKLFYDAEHARNSLVNSVVRFKGKPVYIQDIQVVEKQRPGGTKQYKIVYSVLGSQDSNILFYPNKLLDLNPVPLGMMSTENGVYFVERLPIRGYKIGLNTNNTAFSHVRSGQKSGSGRGGMGVENYIVSKELYKCIMGEHVSYGEGLRNIIKGVKKASSFSRRFSIESGSLMYRNVNDVVGICEKKEPILFDDYHYLSEVLEEDLQ